MMPLRPHQRNHLKTIISGLHPSWGVRTVEIFKTETKMVFWRSHHLHKIVTNGPDPSKATRAAEVFMKPSFNEGEVNNGNNVFN
jgi:hypothetical protein